MSYERTTPWQQTAARDTHTHPVEFIGTDCTPSLAEILGWVVLFACCIFLAIEMLNDGRILMQIAGMVAGVIAEVAAILRVLQ